MVKITPYDITELFNKSYARVAIVQKGISEFSASGIYPMNPNIFTKEDFYASSTFNNNTHVVTGQDMSNTPTSTSTEPRTMNSSPSISMEEISPIPQKYPQKVLRRAAEKQHSCILTLL